MIKKLDFVWAVTTVPIKLKELSFFMGWEFVPDTDFYGFQSMTCFFIAYYFCSGSRASSAGRWYKSLGKAKHIWIGSVRECLRAKLSLVRCFVLAILESSVTTQENNVGWGQWEESERGIKAVYWGMRPPLIPQAPLEWVTLPLWRPWLKLYVSVT